jgi:hypothetical protein
MSGGYLFNNLDDPELEDSQTSEDDILDQEEQLDEEMSEAEKRINLAGYYKQLAKGGIFNDASEEAKIVDKEVRQFARERMAILLGLPSAPKPKVELPFTENQIQVLQWMADRYYEKQQQAVSQPAMRPPAPPAVVPPPQVAKPTIPTIKPLSAPANAQKSESKPVRKAKTDKSKIDYDKISDGEVFLENGKHWKFVTNPETGKRLKLGVNLKRQVTPPHRQPMPSNESMAMISEQQAMNQVVNAPINQTEKRRNFNNE